MTENQKAAKTGDEIAKRARLELENQTGKPVVTGENCLPPSHSGEIRSADTE